MTKDLSKFGSWEIEQAKKLLDAYKKSNRSTLGDNVQLVFDQNNGSVYLVDEKEQYALNTDNGDLENWYFSPSGEFEGFFEELKDNYNEMSQHDKIWFDYLKAENN